MKTLILLVSTAILALATGMAVAQTTDNKPKTETFSIRGHINGLQKGDTLSFQSATLPSFKINPGFDIIIQNNSGKFAHKGTQPHTQLYIMIYKPAVGKAPSADRWGREILITDRDKLVLSGERNYTAFCKIQGGIYNDPTLLAAQKLEDSLGMIRSDFGQKIEDANSRNDTTAAQKYSDAFNNFQGGEASKRARALWGEYYSSPSTSELATIDLLQTASFTSVAELDSAWVKLPSAVQHSYHGRLFEQVMHTARRLEPGQNAPNFTLTNDQGEQVSLSDFRGKYLLIYHWGTCPGSMQVDPSVKELYNRCAPQQLAIIGVSRLIREVKELRAKVSPTYMLYGMNVAERVDGMLNHPYADFDLTIQGNDIEQIYLFGGLPYFIFISPEQKIIARGFQEVFEQACDQMKTKEE